MLGDFFKISNQDKLNRHQLHDLIIEARLKRIYAFETPNRKRLHIKEIEKRDMRIQREQERIDAMNNKKEKIEIMNKLAEETHERTYFHESIEERAEKAVERQMNIREKKEAILNFVKEKRSHEKESLENDAQTRSFDTRDTANEIRNSARTRQHQAEQLNNAYFDSADNNREKHLTDITNKREELASDEQDRIVHSDTRQQANKDALPSPTEYSKKIAQDQQATAEAGQERSRERIALGGEPNDKNKAFQARKAESAERGDQQRTINQELFDQAYARVMTLLKKNTEAIYKNGTAHRQSESFQVDKARNKTEELAHRMLTQRWQNLFKDKKTDERIFRFIALHIAKELRLLWREKNIPEHEPNELLTYHLQPRLCQDWSFEKTPGTEKDITRVNETVPVPLQEYTVDETLLSEPAMGGHFFEQHIEELIKENSIIPPVLEKESLITYLENLETRHPTDEALRETDRSTPSAPERNPHKEIADIITFIDDIESQEAERIDLISQEIARETEAKEVDEKNILEKINDNKKTRDTLAEEQRIFHIQQYYSKLIADQNKSAHDKAVELGQFINLFF